MKMVAYQDTQVYTAGEMYKAGHSIEEIKTALGVSDHTAKGYVRMAGFNVDTRKYHRETPSGEIELTESGQKWATEWTAVQVMFAVLGLEAKHG